LSAAETFVTVESQRSVTKFSARFRTHAYDPAMQHRAEPTKRADKALPAVEPLTKRRREKPRLIEDQPDTFVKPRPVPENLPTE
jgi:hypothetical protein